MPCRIAGKVDRRFARRYRYTFAPLDPVRARPSTRPGYSRPEEGLKPEKEKKKAGCAKNAAEMNGEAL